MEYLPSAETVKNIVTKAFGGQAERKQYIIMGIDLDSDGRVDDDECWLIQLHLLSSYALIGRDPKVGIKFRDCICSLLIRETILWKYNLISSVIISFPADYRRFNSSSMFLCACLSSVHVDFMYRYALPYVHN